MALVSGGVRKLDGPANMSLDAALLESAERDCKGGFRVYGWDGPWISLGMWQCPEQDLLSKDLVPWVMRPTGGRAVLHGHDVTAGMAFPLSVIARETGESQERLARSVRSVYRWLAKPIIAALNECGLPAVLAENRHPRSDERSRSPDCFGHVSPNDIVDQRTGMKVCGCALRLTRKAVLLQASIPAGPPLIDPRLIFEKPSLVVAPPWNGERFADAFEAEVMRKLDALDEFDESVQLV